MQTFAQCLSLFALKFDEPMRDTIFVEEIIELTAFACAACSENAQPGKLPIASQSLATHDQCLYDDLAHTGQFGERAPEFGRGHVEYLGFRRGYPHRGQGRRALQHRDIANEIALACSGEDLFRAIARLESLDLAAQDNGQTKVALPGFENQVATF